MSWVGVRYRGITLPDIMRVMRIWLDHRQYQPRSFECVISGSGALVGVEFTQEAEAAEFAQAFAGFLSRDRPSIEGTKGVEVSETSAERLSSHGS
jgi:hypothetical protein